MFSYLGFGLMAARTSTLQLGNNVKDCKCLYYFIVYLFESSVIVWLCFRATLIFLRTRWLLTSLKNVFTSLPSKFVIKWSVRIWGVIYHSCEWCLTPNMLIFIETFLIGLSLSPNTHLQFLCCSLICFLSCFFSTSKW